jgi:hypothetical protein
MHKRVKKENRALRFALAGEELRDGVALPASLNAYGCYHLPVGKRRCGSFIIQRVWTLGSQFWLSANTLGCSFQEKISVLLGTA